MSGEDLFDEEASAPLDTERQRILDAYSRRREAGVDGGWFGHEDEAHFLRVEERHREMRRFLASAGLAPLAGRRVLDIGCGEGAGLMTLVSWRSRPEDLAGIDLRPEPIDRARGCLPAADLRVGCGSDLPWPDGTFDLVIASTLFSSILDPGMREEVATSISRVLREGGAALIYDTVRDNPLNPDVSAVPVRELRELFDGFELQVCRLTFFPHWARRLPPAALRAFYPWLPLFPWWTSHRLTLARKVPATGDAAR